MRGFHMHQKYWRFKNLICGYQWVGFFSVETHTLWGFKIYILTFKTNSVAPKPWRIRLIIITFQFQFQEHRINAVSTFLSILIKHCKQIIPDMETVIIFSDGATSQYKNQHNFINLCHLHNDFGLKIQWHLFCSR